MEYPRIFTVERFERKCNIGYETLKNFLEEYDYEEISAFCLDNGIEPGKTSKSATKAIFNKWGEGLPDSPKTKKRIIKVAKTIESDVGLVIKNKLIKESALEGKISLYNAFDKNTIKNLKDYLRTHGLDFKKNKRKSDFVNQATNYALEKYNKKAYDDVINGGVGQEVHPFITSLYGKSLEDIRKVVYTKTSKALKEYCVKSGYKPPDIKRDYMRELVCSIAYGGGLHITEEDGVINKGGQFYDYSNLTSVNFSERHIKNWKKTLKKYGVAVVPIPDFDFEKILDDFYTWMENIEGSRFTRDKKDHQYFKDLPTTTHCIFKSYLAHQPWMWETRVACLKIFQDLWDLHGDKDLLSSFDAASFIPAPNQELKNKEKSWFHVDQGRDYMGLDGNIKSPKSYQGIVYLKDSGAQDGGFCFIEKSHLVYDDYIKRHPTYGYTWKPVDIKDKAYSERRLMKANVPAGHMLIFDSKLAHSNVKSRGESRACIYVSMMPRKNATEAELKTRRDIYDKDLGTGHWCYGPFLKKGSARVYSVGQGNPDFEPEPTTHIDYEDLDVSIKNLI